MPLKGWRAIVASGHDQAELRRHGLSLEKAGRSHGPLVDHPVKRGIGSMTHLLWKNGGINDPRTGTGTTIGWNPSKQDRLTPLAARPTIFYDLSATDA